MEGIYKEVKGTGLGERVYRYRTGECSVLSGYPAREKPDAKKMITHPCM